LENEEKLNWKNMKTNAGDLLEKLKTEANPFYEFFKKGNFSLEIYKPMKVDLQKPHDQDEVYIIISGTGMFKNGVECYPFRPNDLIFVPAKVDHHFYDFSEDFCTWVIFFGEMSV
jgi:mannose-6-phosphate isomerase-like protein (cupin superfamily)